LLPSLKPVYGESRTETSCSSTEGTRDSFKGQLLTLYRHRKDGSEATNFLPCGNSTATSGNCCLKGEACLDTGLCYGGIGLVYRGACVNEWGGDCVTYCDDVSSVWANCMFTFVPSVKHLQMLTLAFKYIHVHLPIQAPLMDLRTGGADQTKQPLVAPQTVRSSK
jgi:hypothetical protein